MMTTANRVIDILARVADAEIVRTDPEVRLFDGGYLDSLGTVELILELSREFDVALSPAEIDREEWATPSRIVGYMERRVRR